jgi:hypothetical protein
LKCRPIATDGASVDERGTGRHRLGRSATESARAAPGGELGQTTDASIPGACSGWEETQAADRLFDHDAVTAEAVLAPHIACTEAHLRAQLRVLCIQETTELDYTKKITSSAAWDR